MITLQRIPYGSDAYASALTLRYRYLRQPLGLEFTSEEQEMDRTAIHIVACNKEGPIGCVIVQPGTDGARIRQMVVEEAFRKQGTGSRLLYEAEQQAYAEGMRYALIHARLESLSFYEKHGYQRLGQPYVEIGIPHHTLGKALSSGVARAEG